MFDCSLAFVMAQATPSRVNTIIESSAVIATSITALVMALRQANKPKRAATPKPSKRASKVVAPLSQEAVDEIGARR
jgi:hypothetical protein